MEGYRYGFSSSPSAKPTGFPKLATFKVPDTKFLEISSDFGWENVLGFASVRFLTSALENVLGVGYIT